MTRWQWHPSVHERWGGERLYFWRLAFSPTYDRAKVTTALVNAMDAHGVTAFGIHELFGGGYDVLLQVWLPSTHAEFERTLEHALREYVVVMQPFSVTKIVTDWPWTDAQTGALRTVSAGRLRKRLPDREIERINEGQVTAGERRQYADENLIAKVPAARGITFAVVISANQHPMSHYAVERLEQRLKHVLLSAPDVEGKALYAGMGFGQYLLMGCVRDYFAITSQITEPINTAVDPATFGARTTTFLVSMREPLAFRDDLARPEQEPGALALEDYLSREESQTLEVKGSAFVDLARWIHSSGPIAEDDRVVDSLLRAVVGMLNADGGVLVIGALEVKRFSDAEQLEGVPTRGHYFCVGVELDWGKHDWDVYERKLRSILSSRVRPDPNPWVALTPERIEDRTLCMVGIRVPDRASASPGGWFYHYSDKQTTPRFWARQGNRTVELSGPDLDVYRHEKAVN